MTLFIVVVTQTKVCVRPESLPGKGCSPQSCYSGIPLGLYSSGETGQGLAESGGWLQPAHSNGEPEPWGSVGTERKNKTKKNNKLDLYLLFFHVTKKNK